MKVISHRGYWKDQNEQNTLNSLEDSFRRGFGIETDLRDLDGKIVISHDMPTSSNPVFFDQFLNILHCNDDYQNLWLALNIKSDGLAANLLEQIRKYDLKNYFIFDNSIPDLRSYISLGIKFFIRQSEYESDLPFYSETSGVWLDSFESDIDDKEQIQSHLDNKKQICVVSPELHGRDHMSFWKFIAEFKTDSIMLCTDYPDEAQAYFNE